MADETYTGIDPQGVTYTVERDGVVVTTTYSTGLADTVRCDNVPEARAEFAEMTCDFAGPAAPRPDDLIDVYDIGRKVRVLSVEAKTGANGDHWLITDDTHDLVAVAPGDFRIIARPVA